MIRIIGLVLIAFGATLLILGYNASQSVGEKVVEGFKGALPINRWLIWSAASRPSWAARP